MKYSGNLPTSNINVSDSQPIKEFILLVLALFAIISVIYALLDFAVSYAVQKISPQQEKTLFLSFIDKHFTSKEDGPRSAALQKLADGLKGKCFDLPYEIRVLVTEKDEVNAIALPGGTIMVYSGLLEKVRSENELVFILGHEMGHFKNKDHLLGLGRGIVFMVLSIAFLGADNGANKFFSTFLNFSESSFSRQQEFKADVFALNVVQCRYGHISGATQFFETLIDEEKSTRFSHFFASHPDTTERIKTIENLAQSQKFGEGTLTEVDPVFSKK